MKLLDTNVIIRFLLKDHPTQSPASKTLFENSTEDLILSDVGLAEIIWLLTSFYKFSKQEVIEKIYNLLKVNNLVVNRTLIIRTLYFYGNFSINYIDAYLAAYSEQEKLERIYSFNKDLDKIKPVKRFEPK
ncbi:PIN domain-containing protein [Patescibacteria group bacterium]|nr:PIN domain-containing protein [Patescibacteria group bacterium]